MKKLSLELDTVAVQSFETEDAASVVRGTVNAFRTGDTCYCVTHDAACTGTYCPKDPSPDYTVVTCQICVPLPWTTECPNQN